MLGKDTRMNKKQNDWKVATKRKEKSYSSNKNEKTQKEYANSPYYKRNKISKEMENKLNSNGRQFAFTQYIKN